MTGNKLLHNKIYGLNYYKFENIYTKSSQFKVETLYYYMKSLVFDPF